MKQDRLYLEHIREAIGKIDSYTASGRDEFLHSSLIQDAVIRNFEIIGEASKQLSEHAKGRCPDVPWTRVAGFRDVLIHHYSGVNVEEVWNIIETHLPLLRNAVMRLPESEAP